VIVILTLAPLELMDNMNHANQYNIPSVCIWEDRRTSDGKIFVTDQHVSFPTVSPNNLALESNTCCPWSSTWKKLSNFSPQRLIF